MKLARERSEGHVREMAGAFGLEPQLLRDLVVAEAAVTQLDDLPLTARQASVNTLKIVPNLGNFLLGRLHGIRRGLDDFVETLTLTQMIVVAAVPQRSQEPGLVIQNAAPLEQQRNQGLLEEILRILAGHFRLGQNADEVGLEACEQPLDGIVRDDAVHGPHREFDLLSNS
jgi:hypothetical protein